MSETHAITTLDDMELDAVCGGSFSVGGDVTDSFNHTVLVQKIRQSSSIWGSSNTVDQTAMNMASISQSF
jgi:hypothetical protein